MLHSRAEIQRPAPVAAFNRHGFAGVDADPHAQGQRRVGSQLVGKPALQVDRAAKRLPRRVEHAQRLVAAQLDDPPGPCLHLLAADGPESLGEPRRGLVPGGLGERRIATDVRDQKCPDSRRRAPLVGHPPSLQELLAGPGSASFRSRRSGRRRWSRSGRFRSPRTRGSPRRVRGRPARRLRWRLDPIRSGARRTGRATRGPPEPGR